MKKIILVIVAALFTINVFAQTPQKMSYQAVIRNSSNALIASTSIGIRISILQGSATGTPVYVETQTPTTNANGLVSLEIGSGTIVTGTFAGINWVVGPYFIKTETDPLGGTAYTISGTSQLMSVPYALHSLTAENSVGGFTHYIGELYQGGIIVSVWKVSGVEHGLIASLTDLSSSIAWSDVFSTLIGTTAESPKNGQTNTTAIISQPGHTSSAASLCDVYTSGGYSDWHLPAVWELNQCYNAVIIVNEVLGATNGFQFDSYWSSTEADAANSYFQNFNSGTTNYCAKSISSYNVRAVRVF